MKLKLAALLLGSALLFQLVPVQANDYDRNDTDNPIRLVAYVLHPFGVALEWAVMRPVHWLAHQSGFSYVMGHEPRPRAHVVMPITRMEDLNFTSEMFPTSEQRQRDLLGGDVEMNILPDSVEYIIVQDVLFTPGKANLSAEGKAVLQKVVSVLRQEYTDEPIIVEGHTDDQPIRSSGWRSNWELGSARALTLVHFLVDEVGFDADRLSAMNYGQFKPRVSNDTAENRRLNRRAVITVVTGPEAQMPIEMDPQVEPLMVPAQ
ncbi:OmpA family protein [bacterium]|nr:OmpA family protein [bacterium]